MEKEKAKKAIKMAEQSWQKAEAEKLRKLEEKRRIEDEIKRKEDEIKRKEDEAKKKWEAFLAKGMLFKPTVVTVGLPAQEKVCLQKIRLKNGRELPNYPDQDIKHLILKMFTLWVL